VSQQWVRQAARPSALDAQAVRRKERAGRERRLEGLAVAVLTALGVRDGAVRDAERRAGEALRTMTNKEGLSVREAVDRCGSGGLTVREVTRLRRLAHDRQTSTADERSTSRGGWLAPPHRAVNDPLSDDLPSCVHFTSSHPRPKEAATASVPTSTALTIGDQGIGRAAISRLSSTGTCSMKAA
jgi:hypothetical protein